MHHDLMQTIVDNASIRSFIAQPTFVRFNLFKGALFQLTRCLTMDLFELNTRVNCVCLGDYIHSYDRRAYSF